MKKVTMLLLMAATMFTFASCNKENENTNANGGDTPAEPHGRMYGTSWVKTYKDFSLADEGYYEDHLYIYFCTATLRFLNNHSGERTLSKDIYDEIQHVTVEHHSDTVVHFTYVYKNNDNLFGPGVIYWDNGDSSNFYIQGFENDQRLYLEGEDFPDNSMPVYNLNTNQK